VLVSLVVFVFAVGLLIEGYTHGVLGENSADEPAATPHGQAAPANVTSGGPVTTVVNGQPRSYRIPRKTVVLSFDDGPDPTWTPPILAILKRYRVPGTFFLVGAHAASYPDIVSAELTDGDEVGSHTYTHDNLGTSPRWRESLELTLTQNALAGAAGIHTRLLRMPFSSEPDAMSAADWQAARQAAEDGYLVVFTSLDTRDWARPGARHIVAAAMPRGGSGAIIMFHDGGGDRAQTVAALPAIIERLKGAGYRFATVTSALKLADGDVPVVASQRFAGRALVLTQQAADYAVAVLAVALITMSVLTVIRLLLLVGFAMAHRRRERRLTRWVPPDAPKYLPDVSVVIPAYNEAAGIAAAVRSMAASRYLGRLEVIVVDDGSTDDTAAIARGLGIPYVRVITQRNTGKPGALNHGIAAAHSEILVLVDGDTVFEPDTIERLVAPLENPWVGAVSGNTKVANRRGFIGGWQHLEYVMGFNLDRRMYDLLSIMPTVPGAIGAFRRRALTQAGGCSHDTLAEDTDLTMALCRDSWRVVYAPGAVAWTEAPSTVRQLWKQRYRWSYGTMQSMWKHRRAVIERGKSGRFGRWCLTYLALFQVLMPLVAPAIDVSSVYGLMFLNPVHVAAFWLGFLVLQAAAGAYALWIDGERLRALWVLPFQQVVYRQLMYLVTIQSVFTALLGTRQRWQATRRTGIFADEGSPTETVGSFLWPASTACHPPLTRPASLLSRHSIVSDGNFHSARRAVRVRPAGDGHVPAGHADDRRLAAHRAVACPAHLVRLPGRTRHRAACRRSAE
jgi:cellulose synthase/poly-beta-1,6-N-acetylglucosamine synthase-like glycosyltransferase/peptidoglycan/xylan/chitin deacetylase (PgdA/CDA1 family)